MTDTEEMVIAVDPGGTTGYSYWQPSYDVPLSGQLEPQEFCVWAEGHARSFEHRLTFVVEKFTITQRTLKVSRGGSYDALEVIGVCRYLSKLYCDKDLIMQQPSEVMAMFPDEWLKTAGWYVPGKGHGNDALRHMARYLAKRKIIGIMQ